MSPEMQWHLSALLPYSFHLRRNYRGGVGKLLFGVTVCLEFLIITYSLSCLS